MLVVLKENKIWNYVSFVVVAPVETFIKFSIFKTETLLFWVSTFHKA
jgi:hypothetical protein